MEVLRLRQRLNEILAFHCKVDVEQVLRDTDRDKFMDAETAKRYGLVDEVLARPSDPSKNKNPALTKGA
jgi:ATP-dependent Clp protease protease subunit